MVEKKTRTESWCCNILGDGHLI